MILGPLTPRQAINRDVTIRVIALAVHSRRGGRAAWLAYAISPPGWRGSRLRSVGSAGLIVGLRGPRSLPKTGRSAPPWRRSTSDADWAQLEPDFKAGKKALSAEDWNGAVAAFELAALRDPRNADIQNYIGYAYRRLRQLGPAIGHYQQALSAAIRATAAPASISARLIWCSASPPRPSNCWRRWKISA